jgi:hypothetical protein
MGGRFDEPAYPSLQDQDFGPDKPFRVELQNQGRTVAIGDHTDLGFRITPAYVSPGPNAIDVVIHGLPGRFIERLGGIREIPVPLTARLIESAGILRGTPLRLLTCHAAEMPLNGPTVARMLATEWGGPVEGPDGMLIIYRGGRMRIDLVDWAIDALGGMMPDVVRQGLGSWVPHSP